MPEKRDAAADLAVCEKATEGPWVRGEVEHGGHQYVEPSGRDGPSIASMGNHGKSYDNAEFVVLARDALPYWIHEAERLRTMLETEKGGGEKCGSDIS